MCGLPQHKETAQWNITVPAVRDWARSFFESLPALIHDNDIRPGPITLRRGIEGIPDGVDELYRGVSATKLVYEILHT